MRLRLLVTAAAAIAASSCWIPVDNATRYRCDVDKDCGGDGYSCVNNVCCNPSKETCGNGNGGGAGGSGGSGGTGGTGGAAGCPTGFDACGGGCVDLLQSTDNCGVCGTACNGGEVCFAGTCAALSTVNPYLSLLAPTSVNVGGTATLNLTGERFDPGALVRLIGVGISIERPLTVADPQHASVDVDLTTTVPGSAEVRVVNPGKLVSNTRVLTLAGTVSATPTLTSISPTLVPIGYTAAITVNGTSLDLSAKVQLTGGGLTMPQQFSTVLVSTNQLFVPTFNLTGLPGGSYQVNVAYTAGTTNSIPLTVQGAVPTITTLSPTRAPRGSMVTLTVNGTNFDATSAVRITSSGGTSTAVPTTLVNATQLTAGPLDLTPFVAGNYGITVRNNSAFDSNAVGFVVESNDPTLISVSPAGGRQDQTVDLTLSGARFITGAVVSISSATLPQQNLTTTFISDNSVKVMGLALGAYAIGGYNLVVRNPGSNPSASVSLTVTEGTPVITTVNPNTASITAAQPTIATLTGTYFYPSSVVSVTGGSLVDSPLPTTYLTPTTLRVTQDLSGQSTGAYTLKVLNPGSPAPLASNTVPFTLTP